LFDSEFTMPQNGPEGLKGQVYSFDCGPAHFVVLDSQFTEERMDEPTVQRQVDWLARDLRDPKVAGKWKLVFFHKTPHDLKPARHSDEVRNALCPMFDACHVDVVFCGHDHGLARTWPLRANQAVARPSQGTVYYVTGRSGRKTYPDLMPKPVDAYFLNPLAQPVYLAVEVVGDRLTVKCYGQDGALLDDLFLDRQQDADTDTDHLPTPAPHWSE
jgi:hypothetical protein